MAKLKKFCINFINSDGVCYSGSELGGAVVLEIEGKFKVKELRLRFHGYASVHWSERHSSGQGKSKRTVTKHYTGEELYFDHAVVLFAARGTRCETMPPGEHTFPFEFQVPESCPTSYEGSWGRIRYEAVATIEKMFGVGQSTINGFSVVSHFDLNQDSRAQTRMTAENDMSLCCLCCKSGPIVASLMLDSVGFVPGQGIPIWAEISNRSSRKIAAMTASLQMIVKYNAVKKNRTHRNIIASVSKTDFSSRSGGTKTVTWTGDQLVVPAVPPSYTSGCRIIDISYLLELTVHPSGPSFKLSVKMEVLVGTSPLRSGRRQTPGLSNIRLSQLSDHPGTDQVEEGQRGAVVTSMNGSTRNGSNKSRASGPSREPSASSAPTMCFKECILGPVNLVEEEDFDDIPGPVHFTPRYPYYNFAHSQSPFHLNSKP